MFDFRMKHKGAPPARVVAQMRVQFRDGGFPAKLGDVFAPFMEAGEEIGEELAQEITRVLNFLKAQEITGEEAYELIRKTLEEMASDQGEAEDPEDDDIIASWGAKGRGKEKAGLCKRIMTAVNAELAQSRAPSIARMGLRHNPLGSRNGPSMTAVLSDALLGRIDRRHKPTIGAQFASMSLGEMAFTSARASGLRPLNVQEAIRMASHTTSDFPQILSGALGQSIARQMEQITPALQKAAHEISAESYRPANLLSLSASGVPKEIGEGGEIGYVTIDETGERKPAPRDFGALFRLSNKAIQNDDLGMFDQIGRQMVAGATERYRRVLLEPLLANSGLGHAMADGKPVFHVDHRNLAQTGSELTLTSLSAARLSLRTQMGPQGELYGVEPWGLVVPPQLETSAQQLLAEINATKTADVNPFSGALELIVEAGLTDPKAWYLIGNPSTTDGLAYSFLDGQAAPRVETKPGWETLGMEFRLIWALDARFVNYASWYKNPGAAG